VRRAAFVLALLLAGCGSLPDGDRSTGCAPGLPDGAVAGVGEPTDAGQPFAGLEPTAMSIDEVVQIAADARLHTSWRYTYATGITGDSFYTECWCVPPPGGRIGDMFYDEAGGLIVFVASDDSMLISRAQPAAGWGC
jgi:hypothetical protein